jgi:hypothetical protein
VIGGVGVIVDCGMAGVVGFVTWVSGKKVKSVLKKVKFFVRPFLYF